MVGGDKFPAAGGAPESRRHFLYGQYRPLGAGPVGDGFEGEAKGVGHDAAQSADAEADFMDARGPGLAGFAQNLADGALHDGILMHPR
jgi:hypothetical protein